MGCRSREMTKVGRSKARSESLLKGHTALRQCSTDLSAETHRPRVVSGIGGVVDAWG